MAAAMYKLRCSLFGHSMDVRGIGAAYFPEGSIITTSRDRTARVWIPNGYNQSFTEGHCMSGHTSFVQCVCVFPPSEQYPHGLILTGSNDKNICAFTIESPKPVYILAGHTDTVCCLASGKFGTLLSGSWDSTAKVWLNQKCMMTLQGHTAAVWAVLILPEHGIMLTGSADKTIRLWKTGKCNKVFTGHTDCVRGLAALSSLEFLSCSNDTTVRRWLTSGECLHEYYGHPNYIYSIAILPNGQDFVTAGEDRILKIWINNECAQTLYVPAQCVWSVTVLSNGDIACGCSDGIGRVFTCDPSRLASNEEVATFEEELANFALPAPVGEVGGVKINELPGKEALYDPGTRDGQTKMIRIGSKVEAYHWSSEGKWTKIGEVVGSAEATESSAGKKSYQGKDYDYVFDVDIEDGKPALKLPYNITEDPWFAAQRFLDNNNLSQLFLDQVANYIVENTKGITLGQTSQPYSDPFTGESRYIPGGGDTTVPAASDDPFTGTGRYIPAYSPSNTRPGQGEGTKSGLISNEFFPQKTYLCFDSAKSSVILGKLKEFNEKVDRSLQLSLEDMNELNKIFDNPPRIGEHHKEALKKLFNWPPDLLFPVLDIARMAFRSPEIVNHFFNDQNVSYIIHLLVSYLSSKSLPANQMLSARALCNAFPHERGAESLANRRNEIITGAIDCMSGANKNLQVAISSLLLNYSIMYTLRNDEEAKCQCIIAIVTVMDEKIDHEAAFRLMVALGTIILEDSKSLELVKSLNILPLVNKLKMVNQPEKLGKCANSLSQVLQL